MDTRLERLSNSLMNSWFPTDIKMFESEEAYDVEEIIELFFTDLIERYRTAFPSFKGRIYSDFDLSNRLYLQDIDEDILRLSGITNTNLQMADRLNNITGRDIVNTKSASPYMSEQAALDLYEHIIVDEWSGRMDDPLIMYDSNLKDEYILPSMGDFIVLYIAEREIDIDHVPSSLYPSLEAFLTYKLAGYVIGALGRYPLGLALKDIGEETEDTATLDPKDIQSITINGKLTLSMAASASEDYEKLSTLFSSGSGATYIDQLNKIYNNYKKIFEVLKYTRLGGISTI